MDDEFDVRPGRSGDRGNRSWGKARTLVGQLLQVSRRAGRTSLRRDRPSRGTGRLGRGKRAALQVRRNIFRRRVVIKARIVRHRGTRFGSGPLAKHISYLERDGVTNDGSEAEMFDRSVDVAGGGDFATRCCDDRHHFRFIVSPEDAGELADLRAFTRELMDDMAHDLGTRLDWIAVDHWNTANPHVHVLVRGIADDGSDLVIDRGYISSGMRARAEERVTAELGPRSERDIRNALRREVEAERWTGLDRRLQRMRDDNGVIDLRPPAGPGPGRDRSFLVGRAQALESMGLAERTGPASWKLADDIETTLRALGDRGDIIRMMHRAMAGQGSLDGSPRLDIHAPERDDRVIGRLVERGLHDELTGEGYGIVEGIDGRTHYLRFHDIERTGDAAPGAIVERSSWTDRSGRRQAILAVRSDLAIEHQIDARGATWLDRQLVTPHPEALGGSFGSQVGQALEKRAEVLLGRGLAQRQGQSLVFARNLLGTLRERELAAAGGELASRLDRSFVQHQAGDTVQGVYRERVALASGRYAAIDNGHNLQLVPWRQDLDRHLGQAVAGTVSARGTIEWGMGRSRGPAI